MIEPGRLGKTLALALLFWSWLPARAEEVSEAVPAIRNPHRSWMILPVFEAPFVEFEIASHDEGRSFKSNANSLLGARVAYDGYSVGYSFSVKNRDNVDRYGESRSLDHGLSYYGESFGVHARLQRYSGLYAEDAQHRGDAFEKRPDIGLVNYELNGLYVFDPSAFSMEAAWGFSKIQLVSGGSWLTMLSLQHLSIAGDRPLAAGVERFAMDALSLLGGYGYNFIGPSFYYGMIAGLLGGGLQRREAVTEERSKRHIGGGVKMNFQISVGRNGDDFLYGLTFNMLTTSSEFESMSINYTLTPLGLFAGVRL